MVRHTSRVHLLVDIAPKKYTELVVLEEKQSHTRILLTRNRCI